MDGSTLFALPFTCWWAFSLFLTWSLKNTADVNIGGQVYIWTPALNSLDVYLGVDIPKHNCQNMTIQFSQSCLTLCDPMDCSTPGFPIHYQLLELAQIHVHRVGDAIQPSHPVTSFCSCLQSYPASESFLMNQFFTSGGQSIGVSASASVLPMNIQGWFPLGLTGCISLQSKRFTRVFSNTTVQKHHFLGTQFSL